MKTRVIQAIVVAKLVLLTCTFIYADGLFIPEARQRIPGIPVQRALISYQNGIETLIIESSLDGEENNYGWIIPIPSEPHKIEELSPGLLKTLSTQIHPKIHDKVVHQHALGVRTVIIYAVLMAIVSFSIMLWGAPGFGISSSVCILIIFAIPRFIELRGGPGPSSAVRSFVEIKSSQIVGNYEIFILEAQDSLELNNWLDNSNLDRFPENASQIIDDYISDGWYFAVAKLATLADGISRPHPVLFEFYTDTPVYPMKLTALSGSTVNLELFVIADEEAIPVNFNIEKQYCDFFDYEDASSFSSYGSEIKKVFVPRNFYAMDYERRWYGGDSDIAHSDAYEIMWDGCVVTKFVDKISSEEMNEDMYFKFKYPNPSRSDLYTSKGKSEKAFSVSLTIFMIGFPLFAILYRFVISKKKMLIVSKLLLQLYTVSFTAFFCFVGFVLTHLYVGETVEAYYLEPDWKQILVMQIHDIRLEFDPKKNEDFIKALEDEGVYNPFTKQPMIAEDSPGNILFEGGGIKICLVNGSMEWLF